MSDKVTAVLINQSIKLSHPELDEVYYIDLNRL